MLFFPYRVDLDLRRVPWVTMLVCLVCPMVFVFQVRSALEHQAAVGDFCGSLDRISRMIVNSVEADPGESNCAALFARIHDSEDADAAISELSAKATGLHFYRDQEVQQLFVRGKLRAAYRAYLQQVPSDLTRELDYEPLERRFVNMLSSSLTHGNLEHLVFNLIFFYAFAASVEVIVGSAAFGGIMAVSAVTTSLAYSWSVAGAPDSLPSIGLSGVVMAMMTMLAVLAPAIRIRCFFWFVLIVKILRVPALVLAGGYVILDWLALSSGAEMNVNYAAHLGGAATGAVIGAAYWLFRRDRLQSVLPSN